MKILKKSKKGFTLVELVVVIAVIAILAAASVGVYFGVTESAKKSNDQTVTNQMNKALLLDATVNGNPKTPTDALEVLEENGFDVVKMTPFQDNAYYLWDSVENKMILINKEGNVDFPADVDNPTTSTNPEKYFGFIQNDAEKQAQDYSYYLKNGYSGSTTFTAGIDTGNNNLESVSYENSDEQEVIIRTNSATTELIVNAPNGTVKHYDAVGTVHVFAVDDENCYEENGKAAFTQVDSGKYKTTSTADVELLFVSNSSNVTLEIAEGTVDHAHAISEAEANTINSTNPGVTFEYDGNIGLTVDYNNNKSNETIIDIIETAVEKEAVEADESDFWIVCKADQFAAGDGSENNPYIIKTARQLALLAYNINTLQAGNYASAYYKLGKDIDLSGKAWTPIGTTSGNSTVYFKGHFDGNGHSIIGLTNNDKTDVELGLYRDELSSVKGLAASYGLFGFTQDVEIKNVNIESAKVIGEAHFKEAGMLIGHAIGSLTVTNCSIDSNSKLYGLSKLGGIVGLAEDYEVHGNITITDCTFAGEIKAQDRAGAFIGASRSSCEDIIEFSNCSSTGTLTVKDYGVGFIGFKYGGTTIKAIKKVSYVFDNCSIDMSKLTAVEGKGKYIGRIVEGGTIIVKNSSYDSSTVGQFNKGSYILAFNNDVYYYENTNLENMPILENLTDSITYDLGQAIYEGNPDNWSSKICYGENLLRHGIAHFVKINSETVDLSSNRVKFAGGETKLTLTLNEFKDFVKEGYQPTLKYQYGDVYIYKIEAL